MNRKELSLLRKECVEGNERACETLQRVCADGHENACQYVP